MKLSIKYIFLLLFFVSCRKEYTCPAYQSAFIHDLEDRRAYFSPFNSDGTPKEFKVRKVRKTGLAKNDVFTKLKGFFKPKQNVVPMYAPLDLEPDSVMFTVDAGMPPEDDFSEEALLSEDLGIKEDVLAVNDSLALDSGVFKSKFHYNWDQYFYLLHFAKYLPEPTPAPEVPQDSLAVTEIKTEETKDWNWDIESSATELGGSKKKNRWWKRKNKNRVKAKVETNTDADEDLLKD